MECKSLEEVRSNIDKIDNQIVKLIAERSTFVKQAARFKKDSEGIKAPQRVDAIIQKVRALADEYSVSADLVESLYRQMIAGFISMEMDDFNR